MIEDLKEMVYEVFTYNDMLEELYFYDNDENFFEKCFQRKDEIAKAVCYGDYRYTDDYVKFDGCMNLYSISKFEYENLIKKSAKEIFETYIQYVENGELKLEDSNISELSKDMIKKIIKSGIELEKLREENKAFYNLTEELKQQNKGDN